MSTILSAPAATQGPWRQSRIDRLGATLSRWWMAYLTWRLERAAIAQLWAMSDRELKDIGLSRSKIASAVKVEIGHRLLGGRY